MLKLLFLLRNKMLSSLFLLRLKCQECQMLPVQWFDSYLLLRKQDGHL